MYWLVALVVWMAAGARVGRVLVRPATPVRVAIVVGVAAIAAAATFAIPDVAGTIDELAGGFNGTLLSAGLASAAWVVFATAAAVVGIAAWPLAHGRRLYRLITCTYVTGGAVAVIALCWMPAVGWAGVVAGCVFVAITAIKNMSWSPLGRGIAIFMAGLVLIAGLSVWELSQAIRGRAGAGELGLPWIWAAASILVALGAVWILLEVWVRARWLLWRIRHLHRTLTKRFPEVLTVETGHTTTTLRAADQVAHIMDALYLQAGGGAPGETAKPPDSARARAVQVAKWVRDPYKSAMLDPRWIAPPAGLSTRHWIADIARVL